MTDEDYDELEKLTGGESPHYGSDDQMIAWAEAEGLTIQRDDDGAYDWDLVYLNYLRRESKSSQGGKDKQ